METLTLFRPVAPKELELIQALPRRDWQGRSSGFVHPCARRRIAPGAGLMVNFKVMTSVTRELLPGGVVRLLSSKAKFEFTRLGPGRLLVTISGIDQGQFGSATLDEISASLSREGTLELFIDAREAVGAVVSVSDDWTRFFSVQRSRLRRVHVLAGSKAVKLTVAIAQHLSRTGDLIQIYSDPQVFDGRLNSE